jgi:hypothetical protein
LHTARYEFLSIFELCNKHTVLAKWRFKGEIESLPKGESMISPFFY